jgi:hypothetical protein
LDPPYSGDAKRASDLYRQDCLKVAHDVRRWALEWGDDPRMRICVAGYEGEHDFPAKWECVAWKARGGYGSQAADGQNENATKERLWFSPHCLRPEKDRMPLFANLIDDANAEATP